MIASSATWNPGLGRTSWHEAERSGRSTGETSQEASPFQRGHIFQEEWNPSKCEIFFLPSNSGWYRGRSKGAPERVTDSRSAR